MQDLIQTLYYYLPSMLAEKIRLIDEDIQEIRFHSGKPVTVTANNSNYYLSKEGKLSENPLHSVTTSEGELQTIFYQLCDFAVYAHEIQLKEGFLSLRNGCRAGICGTAVYDSFGNMTGFTDITSVCIRFSREVRGCAVPILSALFANHRLNSILLVSPPNFGKTTMLRDIARLVSEKRYRCVVIDERGEISAPVDARLGHEVGLFTDVIVGVPKVKAITQALRTLSPQLILCDEIGTEEEAKQLQFCFQRGVPVVATCHGDGIESIKKKPVFQPLISNGFDYIVSLSSLGVIGEIMKC